MTRTFAAALAALLLGATPALTQQIPAISDGVVRMGVILDMTGPYSANTGQGSVVAAHMAIEDFGKTVPARRSSSLSATARTAPARAHGRAAMVRAGQGRCDHGCRRLVRGADRAGDRPQPRQDRVAERPRRRPPHQRGLQPDRHPLHHRHLRDRALDAPALVKAGDKAGSSSPSITASVTTSRPTPPPR